MKDKNKLFSNLAPGSYKVTYKSGRSEKVKVFADNKTELYKFLEPYLSKCRKADLQRVKNPRGWSPTNYIIDKLGSECLIWDLDFGSNVLPPDKDKDFMELIYKAEDKSDFEIKLGSYDSDESSLERYSLKDYGDIILLSSSYPGGNAGVAAYFIKIY